MKYGTSSWWLSSYLRAGRAAHLQRSADSCPEIWRSMQIYRGREKWRKCRTKYVAKKLDSLQKNLIKSYIKTEKKNYAAKLVDGWLKLNITNYRYALMFSSLRIFLFLILRHHSPMFTPTMTRMGRYISCGCLSVLVGGGVSLGVR